MEKMVNVATTKGSQNSKSNIGLTIPILVEFLELFSSFDQTTP